jgi:hypothetical protein
VSELQRIAGETGNTHFTKDGMRIIAERSRISVAELSDWIDKLNNQGFLLKKGNGVYQLAKAI